VLPERTLSFWLISILLFAIPPRSSASTRVIPLPQYFRLGSQSMALPWKREAAVRVVTAVKPSRAEEVAAGLLRSEAEALSRSSRWLTVATEAEAGREAAVQVYLVDWSTESKPKAAVRASLDAEDLKVLSDPAGTTQAYVVKVDPRKNAVALVGCAPQGVLYAATTLLQLWQADSAGLVIPEVHVRDFPDFKYRAAADWLLRAELNRWAYDWGDGREAYVRRIKRKLEFCLRFKINMVFFDGFGWTAEKKPGYAAMMRDLNRYARERGIKLVFSGFGANFDPRKVEPEFNIGKVFLNRRGYPLGEIYP